MNENPLKNIIKPRPTAAAKDKTSPGKRPSVKDKDPDGTLEFAKSVGPSHPERIYDKDDKGYEHYIDYARSAGKPIEEDDENDPLVAFAKAKAPEKPRYSEEDKGFEAEVDFARAGKPEAEKTNLVEEARIKMEQASEEYAKQYGEARASRKWFQRILDVNVEEGNEEVKKAKSEYLRLQEEYIRLNGETIRERAASGEITEQEALRKMDDMGVYLKIVNGTVLANDKIKFTMEANAKKGWWSRNVIQRCDKAVDWYRKLPMGKKLLVSAAAIGLGLGAAMTGAAFLTWLSTGAVIGIRAMGSASAGKGVQEWLQARNQKKGEKESDAQQEEFKAILGKEGENLEQRLAAAQAFLQKDVQALDQKFSKEESVRVRNRRIGTFAGIGLFAAGTAFQMYRAGWFGGTGKGSALMDQAPKKPGAGTLIPEKIPTAPHGHVISQGDNIWKVTRDIYMENPKGYDYDSSDPNIHKLFNSFRDQGILKKMGINADDFDKLSPGEKIKIWAENKTANSVNKLAQIQGGRVRDLVHAGDTVTLKPDGTIVFNNASGLKTGYLNDIHRPRGAGVYEPQGKGGGAHYDPRGKNIIDTSEFDRRIEEARARGAAADDRLRVIRGRMAELSDARAAEVAATDNTQVHRWMDFVQSKIYGPGTGMDWDEPAKDFLKRMRGSLLTSDQPMGPPSNVGEQQQYWKAAKELTRKLGPALGNESTEEWLQRGLAQKSVSPEEVVSVLNRVVNE